MMVKGDSGGTAREGPARGERHLKGATGFYQPRTRLAKQMQSGDPFFRRPISRSRTLYFRRARGAALKYLLEREEGEERASVKGPVKPNEQVRNQPTPIADGG